MYAVVAIPRIWHFLVCLDDKRIKQKNIKYKKIHNGVYPKNRVRPSFFK